MKYIKYLFLSLIGLLSLVACSDDETTTGDGNPVMTITSVQSAMYGDSITIDVNCKDEGGIPLSTLKASLYYSEEEVQQITVRTKTEGDYQVKMFIPYYKDIPDGNATLKFTLQNIHFTKTEQTLELPLTRPTYSYVELVASNGTVYQLTPSSDNPYLFTGSVTSTSKTVQGYIRTPKETTNANVITFGQGTDGITQGVTGNIAFTNTRAGTFTVTFNVLTYEYSPVYDPATSAQEIELVDAENQNIFVGDLTKGRSYDFIGSDLFLSSDWYYDPDFFTKNDDGTFTFNAKTGIYTIKADFTNKGFKVWAMKDLTTIATLTEGGLWIIGSDCIGKPTYAQISGQGWRTDTDHALCMAQVSDNVYQITLTIGTQLKADGKAINFKFFGQAGWGTEFRGVPGDYYLSTTSTIFAVGDGTTVYPGGKDNGNIYLRDGVTLQEGDTYRLTVDITNGNANAVLSAVKL